jgi:hypothetical protein
MVKRSNMAGGRVWILEEDRLVMGVLVVKGKVRSRKNKKKRLKEILIRVEKRQPGACVRVQRRKTMSMQDLGL